MNLLSRFVSGPAWLGAEYLRRRERHWRAQLAREAAEVEEVAARIARADLHSSLSKRKHS